MMNLYQTECPLCDAALTMSSDTIQDELIECLDCGTELVVTSIDPLMVQEAPQTDEDWGQ